MAFEIATPETTGRPRLSRSDNVVIALDRKPSRVGSEHIDIRIGADLLRRLEWSIGDNLILSEGRDGDLGRIELRRVPAGSVSRILTKYTGSRQDARLRWPISTFRYHHLTTLSGQAVQVMHEVRGGGALVVSLPIWLAVPPPAAPTSAKATPPAQLL